MPANASCSKRLNTNSRVHRKSPTAALCCSRYSAGDNISCTPPTHLLQTCAKAALFFAVNINNRANANFGTFVSQQRVTNVPCKPHTHPSTTRKTRKRGRKTNAKNSAPSYALVHDLWQPRYKSKKHAALRLAALLACTARITRQTSH